jgi:hypothetical protein
MADTGFMDCLLHQQQARHRMTGVTEHTLAVK